MLTLSTDQSNTTTMSKHDRRSYAMTSLFLLHASEDAACAETLHTGLEIQGYRIWREPHNLQMSDILYPHATENAILGSAVVLLIWSSKAAYSAEVARHIPFALDLKKAILPLLLDQTDLPATLHSFVPFVVQSPCTDIVAQLIRQSLLPAHDSVDPLITLAQLAASTRQAERKAAVQQAMAMLQHNEHRLEVLAILAYLAQDDPMIGVRELAKEALDADARRQQTPQPPPLLAPSLDNTDAMIGVRCKKCSHVTYFNKHRICKESRPVMRGGKDKLKLKCGTCGETMMVQVDCEGYK
jgi:TIR domain